jgi:hypothetical protein
MSLAVRHVFSAQDPTYGMLLDLDAKIREYKIPEHLRTPFHNPPTPWSSNEHAAMKQLGAILMTEGSKCCIRCQPNLARLIFNTALLYLHRAYLPLMGNQVVRQKGGASVWAAFRSASRMVHATENLYSLYPERLSKISYFWSAFYISCVCITSILCLEA